MQKYRIITDAHVYSTEAIMTLDELIKAIATCPDDRHIVYLGDNIDLKNVRRKELDKALKDLEYLKLLVDRKLGDFVMGNHDPMKGVQDHFIKDKIYFGHGCKEFWPLEKYQKFCEKPNGAGFLKRKIAVHLIDDFIGWVNPGPNKLFTEFMNKLDPNKIRLVVTGHRHPKETLTGEINGIRYMILSRGIHDLELYESYMTDQEIEFKKFMDLQVEKMKIEHKVFMWKMYSRMLLLVLMMIFCIYLGRHT